MQKGSSAGEKIGKTAAVIGKVTAAGLAAGGAAFAALGTGAVKAYANYEQLTGGVETLFKTSAGVVNQYAEGAYKTAGLSANQYMETITSFSASLLQGLGGDTEKAAEIGNLAVTDMADNANKMGVTIESIQNAYRGFAKDNFTMLDNLNLGYGGTASEMARLVNDSGVLGDSFKATAENVKNIPFDQLVLAIHEVQTEMGITGTTAIEASETISGSWGTLKSSWTNVLTSLASGNQDFFDNSVKGLLESTDNFTNNVMRAVTNVVNGFGQLAGQLVAKIPDTLQQLLPAVLSGAETLLNSVVEALPAMVDVLAEVLPMVAKTILTMLPAILQTGVEVITSLALGIAESLPELVPVAVDAMLALVDTLVNNLDLLADAYIAIMIALSEGLIAALPMLIEKAPVIIQKLVTAIVENAPKLLEAAAKIIGRLVTGIITNLPELAKSAKNIVDTIAKGIGDLIVNIVSVGRDIVSGLWTGIAEKATWLYDKVGSFFGGVIDKVKSVFDSHSDSKVFIGIGQDVDGGFITGIESMAEAIAGAADKVFGTNVIGQIASRAEDYIAAGTGMIEKISEGVTSGEGVLSEALNGVVEKAVQSAEDWLKSKNLNVVDGKLISGTGARYTNEGGGGGSNKELKYDAATGWYTVDKTESTGKSAWEIENDRQEREWRESLGASSGTNVVVNVQSTPQSPSELAGAIKSALDVARWQMA